MTKAYVTNPATHHVSPVAELLEKYNDVFQDISCLLHIDLSFAWANAAFLQTCGLSRNNLDDIVFSDLLGEDDAAATTNILQQIADTNTGRSFDCNMHNNDGGVTLVGWRATYDPDHKLIFMIGRYISDLSMKKDLVWNAIDGLSESIFIVNADAGFEYVNSTACKRLGYGTDELMQMSVPDIAPNMTMAEWPALWQKLAKQGKVSYESEHQRKNGDNIPIELSAQLVELRGKKYFCASTRDLSEIKRMSGEVQMLSEMMAHGSDYVAIYDEQMHIVGANKKYADWYGKDIDDIIGEKIEYLGDPLETIAPAREATNRCLAGESFNYQTWATKPSGEDRYLDINFSPLQRSDTSPTLAVAVARDLTDLKMAQESAERAHEKLSSHIEQSPMAVLQWDSEMRLLGWNAQAEKLFGWRAHEVIGTIVRELKFVHEDDVAAANAKLAGLKAGEYTSYTQENRNYNREEKVLHCVWHISANYDQNGEIESLLGLVQDVTGQEIAQAQVKEYQNKLEQLVESRTRELRDTQDELLRKERLAALGKLTGTVGHELRNPLGTIRTSLHVIQNQLQTSEPKLLRAFERVDRNIDRCDKIISELLDYTRTPILDLVDTNIDEWLTTVLDDYELPRKISFFCRVKSAIDLKIDPDRLQRCVINLVNNAVDALLDSPEGMDRKLDITSQLQNDRLEIVVTDTGMGIDEENMNKISEPLFSTKTYGTGLGLAIVKQILEQHKGGLEISSTRNIGTRAVMWLPLETNQ